MSVVACITVDVLETTGGANLVHVTRSETVRLELDNPMSGAVAAGAIKRMADDAAENACEQVKFLAEQTA